MRQVILVFALLAVVAIGIIAFVGDDGTRDRKAPVMGVVHGSSGLIYRVDDGHHCLAVSVPSDWTEQSQGSYNGSNGYYQANTVFGQRKGVLSAMVQRTSSNPKIVTINGVSYDLAQGTVFRIRAAKAPTKEDEDSKSDDSPSPSANPAPTSLEVIQFPFAPLDVTPRYVDELDEYFTERGYD